MIHRVEVVCFPYNGVVLQGRSILESLQRMQEMGYMLSALQNGRNEHILDILV
jgi:hypothetical protein